MKLLLTSNGIDNQSIADAFEKLVGKPLSDTSVAFIPTAAFVENGDKGWLIDDLVKFQSRGCSTDIVDIAQLTHDEWKSRVSDCDVVCVGGGNSFYLSYWAERSGFLDELNALLNSKVYVGISAGSMLLGQNIEITTRRLIELLGIDNEYSEIRPEGRSSTKVAKIVPFAFRPHYNEPDFPLVNAEVLQKVAAGLDCPIYALDNQSAVQVVDGEINVISEGEWKIFD